MGKARLVLVIQCVRYRRPAAGGSRHLRCAVSMQSAFAWRWERSPVRSLKPYCAKACCSSAIGSAGGLVVTLLAARLLQALLFGVSLRDPLIYSGIIACVACVGLLANLVPARRAASVDAVRALRAE